MPLRIYSYYHKDVGQIRYVVTDKPVDLNSDEYPFLSPVELTKEAKEFLDSIEAKYANLIKEMMNLAYDIGQNLGKIINLDQENDFGLADIAFLRNLKGYNPLLGILRISFETGIEWCNMPEVSRRELAVV